MKTITLPLEEYNELQSELERLRQYKSKTEKRIIINTGYEIDTNCGFTSVHSSYNEIVLGEKHIEEVLEGFSDENMALLKRAENRLSDIRDLEKDVEYWKQEAVKQTKNKKWWKTK